jgi:Derlin-2/3
MDMLGRGGAAGHAAAAGNGFDWLTWYLEIPVVSRIYVTSAFLTTAGCAMDFFNPFHLYFNFHLIFFQGQVWRLFSSFLYFGMFNLDFLLHMFFMVRYCRLLEEGEFHGRTTHFVYFILFSILGISSIATCIGANFLGNSLTFSMTYVWGRRNEDVRMGFFGILQFTAPYLCWAMLAMSFIMGQRMDMDLVGIFIGHLYYFLEYVYPVVAKVRGWPVQKILEPPMILHWLCGTHPQAPVEHVHVD